MAMREPIVQALGQLQQLRSGDTLDIGYPVVGFKNHLINGAFQVWQRLGSTLVNISGGASSIYTADRWKNTSDGNAGTLAISQTAFGNTAIPLVSEAAPYCITFAQTVAGSSQTSHTFAQSLESCQTLSNEIVILSFWAKSTGTAAITPVISQVFGTGGSPSATVSITGSTFTVNSIWTRYSQAFTLASVAGKTLGANGDDCLRVSFNLPINATFNISLAFIQLEPSGVETDFDFRPLAIEEFMCRRYFTTIGTRLNGIFNNTTNFVGGYSLQPTMRVVPTPALSTTTPQFRVAGVGTVFTGAGVVATLGLNADALGGVVVLTGTFGSPGTGLLAFMQVGTVTMDADF